MIKQTIQFLKILGAMLVFINLAACTGSLSHENLHQKLTESAMLSREKFSSDFARAGVAYPPHQLAFLVFKNTREFEIFAKDNNQWKYIDSYRVLAESGTSGPKLHQGDRQVPEGVYHIAMLNPLSHYDMSMQLNYPNGDDLHFAALDHRSNLGDDIFIHGNHSSAGCIPIGDHGIEQLYPLVAEVGPNNVEVVVAPNDLRREKPIISAHAPKWLPSLYNEIDHTLRQFPIV